MPVQELIDKLVKVGEGYPEKSNSFKLWDKHDNQPVANKLKSIRDKVESNVPEKLQEVRLLAALVEILNEKNFVSSTQLITDIKKELSSYASFDSLDKYLPDTCSNKECPKIIELRDAINGLGGILHLEFEIEKSITEAVKGGSYAEVETKEVPQLMDKLVGIGANYPEQPSTVLDLLWGAGKHDNQSVAIQLKNLKNKINSDVPEKLQEVQILIALVHILNSKDLKSSTILITDIKKQLATHHSFDNLDKYLPETCINSESPKINELRNALTSLGFMLHLEYKLANALKQTQITPITVNGDESKVQNLVDKFVKIGELYPEQPPTVLDRLWGSGKHDNQSAANQLMKMKIDNNAPVQLQEVQLLITLIKILNLKDFKSSTLLMTEIKKELFAYAAFNDVDKYLPVTCSVTECPKISELREALTSLAFVLQIRYEKQNAVHVVEAQPAKLSL